MNQKNKSDQLKVGTVLLAAGTSSRMGVPKMLLPWQGTTIIRYVLDVLMLEPINPVVVVVGGEHEKIEASLKQYPVRIVFNPNFSDGSMLESFQVGLTALSKKSVSATLVVLGDQPTIQPKTIKMVLDAYDQTKSALIVPVHQGHKGHPWLVSRDYWNELLSLREPSTLSSFLAFHDKDIKRIPIDSVTIIEDIDTPEEYKKFTNHY